MDIRWLLTPAEPRVHYAFFVGVASFLGMLVAMPVWRGDALVSLVTLAVVLVAAMAVVKLVMSRSSK